MILYLSNFFQKAAKLCNKSFLPLFPEMLIMVPNNEELNLVVTTSILVLLSHEVHKITEVLIPFLVPSKMNLVLRNVMLSLVIVIFFGQY